MTISKKIGLSFAAFIAMTVFIGGISLVSISRLSASVNSLSTDSLPGLYHSDHLLSGSKDFRGYMLIHIGSDAKADKDAMEVAIEKQGKDFDETYNQYVATSSAMRIVASRRE